MMIRIQSAGHHTTMPNELVYNGAPKGAKPEVFSCYCDYVYELRENLLLAHYIAREQLQVAAERQRRNHDYKTAPRMFEPGDPVLHFNKRKAGPTISSGWTGPYLVVEKTGVATYNIQLGPDTDLVRAHVDDLRGDPGPMLRPNWVRKPPVQGPVEALEDLTYADEETEHPTMPELPRRSDRLRQLVRPDYREL